jgi:hypothetical protein
MNRTSRATLYKNQTHRHSLQPIITSTTNHSINPIHYFNSNLLPAKINNADHHHSRQHGQLRLLLLGQVQLRLWLLLRQLPCTFCL